MHKILALQLKEGNPLSQLPFSPHNFTLTYKSPRGLSHSTKAATDKLQAQLVQITPSPKPRHQRASIFTEPISSQNFSQLLAKTMDIFTTQRLAIIQRFLTGNIADKLCTMLQATNILTNISTIIVKDLLVGLIESETTKQNLSFSFFTTGCIVGIGRIFGQSFRECHQPPSPKLGCFATDIDTNTIVPIDIIPIYKNAMKLLVPLLDKHQIDFEHDEFSARTPTSVSRKTIAPKASLIYTYFSRHSRLIHGNQEIAAQSFKPDNLLLIKLHPTQISELGIALPNIRNALRIKLENPTFKKEWQDLTFLKAALEFLLGETSPKSSLGKLLQDKPSAADILNSETEWVFPIKELLRCYDLYLATGFDFSQLPSHDEKTADFLSKLNILFIWLSSEISAQQITHPEQKLDYSRLDSNFWEKLCTQNQTIPGMLRSIVFTADQAYEPRVEDKLSVINETLTTCKIISDPEILQQFDTLINNRQFKEAFYLVGHHIIESLINLYQEINTILEATISHRIREVAHYHDSKIEFDPLAPVYLCPADSDTDSSCDTTPQTSPQTPSRRSQSIAPSPSPTFRQPRTRTGSLPAVRHRSLNKPATQILYTIIE
jgi:hypothetical protein